MVDGNRFLSRFPEKENFNQYWYSNYTIEVLVKEISGIARQAAFLSTPSLYFSLGKGSQLQLQSYLFDFDKQWSKHPNFVCYDYNAPEDVPVTLHRKFDCIVIDPPFITKEVWQKYAATAKLLLAPGGKIVLSTIQENKDIVFELLNVTPQNFKPSIPNLVYQYQLFTNYESTNLKEHNPEVPE